MIDFFMGWVTDISTTEATVNTAIRYKGLCFWALLHCVDACMDLGVTCVEKCGNNTSKTYCIGMPVEKSKK
jgi:hypothetical protein